MNKMWVRNHAAEWSIERTDLGILGENLRSGSELPGQTVGCGHLSVSGKVLVVLALRNPSQV